MIDLHTTAPTSFIWALFAVTALAAALRLRFENREDHSVFTIAATVDIALLGPPSMLLVWGALVAAAPVVVLWSVLPRNRARLGLVAARRSLTWMVIGGVAVTVAFLLGAGVYSGLLDRTYPVQLQPVSESILAGLSLTVAWLGLMGVRVLAIRAISGPVLRQSLDPLDSVLMPYLIPLMGGFPLIVAAVALYEPEDPWSALFILWFLFPIHAATALDVHRRRLGQELRRDLLAKQRLAAIGEVSARIVHQSRHQVGLMGWSIHRLRGLVGQADADAVRTAELELDALAEAKDRLAEMLTSELLEEGDGAAATPAAEALAPLAAQAREVVAQLEGKARASGLTLRVDVATGTGEVAVPVVMRDAVFNLVDNAIDAAVTEVVVQLTGTPAAVELRVVDDGPGIAGEEPSRAFEPFFTTKADGTGMGLAIAEAVVGDLGGDLRYERVDARTAFVVTLPLGRIRQSD